MFHTQPLRYAIDNAGEIDEAVVSADQRDILAAARALAPGGEIAGAADLADLDMVTLIQNRYVVWHAARRSGHTSLPWPEFDAACLWVDVDTAGDERDGGGEPARP